MINQVNNIANKNVFAPLQSSGATYAITKPFTNTQKDEVKIEKEKKSNALGFSIAMSALVVGLGVFVSMKGVSTKSRHNVNKFFRFLEDKSSKLNKNNEKSLLQVIYGKTLNGLKEVTKYSKTLFNTAPLKDSAVTHLLEKTPILKKWAGKITNLFEKISVKTSKRAYSRTLLKFDSMHASFVTSKSKIQNISDADAKELDRLIHSVRTKYHDGFGEHARNSRLIEAKKDMEGIDKQVYESMWGNLKDYGSKKENYQTFISEELVSPAKMKLTDKVNKIREEISISANDKHDATRKFMSNLYDFIDASDEIPRKTMNSLRKNLNNYKKALEQGANPEDAFPNSKIADDLKVLEEYFSKTSKYDDSKKAQALNNIKNINSTLTSSKKGEIQEIMEIYKKYLPEEDYNNLNKSVNKSLKSLRKSIDLETDKLFDKIRDLQIGAAPVDVLGVLSSIGIVGWGLSKAEDKDERISAALKFGIPAIGGVAISLLCTVGLIAGGPSLIIGLVSSVLINKLGVIVDDMRKRYKEKPPTLSIPDPAKIVQGMKDKAILGTNKPAL